LEVVVVADERWLAETWPFVLEHLPAPPARVVELGCGPLGGFVPRMRGLGYDAVGVDPDAPPGPEYRRAEFERYEVGQPLDALVACTSLHHVADLGMVLDRISSLLKPHGRLVIIEWAHERFDEASARWCIDRLSADGDGWMQHHRDHWRESGLSWERFFQAWVGTERLHPARDILRGLQARFDTRTVGDGPYFFAELDGVTRDEEQAAIDAGLVRAGGLYYAGQRPSMSGSGGGRFDR
jgi:SAM-dependent methyltransferase